MYGDLQYNEITEQAHVRSIPPVYAKEWGGPSPCPFGRVHDMISLLVAEPSKINEPWAGSVLSTFMCISLMDVCHRLKEEVALHPHKKIESTSDSSSSPYSSPFFSWSFFFSSFHPLSIPLIFLFLKPSHFHLHSMLSFIESNAVQ